MARARSSAPDAGVPPGKMKPPGITASDSSSLIICSRRWIWAGPVVTNVLSASGLVPSSAPTAYRPRCSSSQIEVTRACEVRARARPSALEASSTVPNASMRGSSLGERPPPKRPVVPSSPVPESSSIGLRRGFSDEDLRELVELLGHAPLLLDHLGERDHLDVAVAPDRDHAALALDDQLHGRDPESSGPDPVDRRR